LKYILWGFEKKKRKKAKKQKKQKSKKSKKAKKKSKKEKKMSSTYITIHEFSFNNTVYTIYEGKNAVGNNDILDLCKSDDVWFHINGRSSAHVVLVGVVAGLGLGKIPKQVIKRCCCICKASTRTSDKVEIIYTERGNLEKLNEHGTVIFVDPAKTKTMLI